MAKLHARTLEAFEANINFAFKHGYILLLTGSAWSDTNRDWGPETEFAFSSIKFHKLTEEELHLNIETAYPPLVEGEEDDATTDS